jgi:hypothetical protein
MGQCPGYDWTDIERKAFWELRKLEKVQAKKKAGVPPRPPAKRWSPDVTYADLANMGHTPVLRRALHWLRDFWCGKSESREVTVRIGSTLVWVDSEGHAHIDFTSRFSLTVEQQEAFMRAARGEPEPPAFLPPSDPFQPA